MSRGMKKVKSSLFYYTIVSALLMTDDFTLHQQSSYDCITEKWPNTETYQVKVTSKLETLKAKLKRISHQNLIYFVLFQTIFELFWYFLNYSSKLSFFWTNLNSFSNFLEWKAQKFWKEAQFWRVVLMDFSILS